MVVVPLIWFWGWLGMLPGPAGISLLPFWSKKTKSSYQAVALVAGLILDASKLAWKRVHNILLPSAHSNMDKCDEGFISLRVMIPFPFAFSEEKLRKELNPSARTRWGVYPGFSSESEWKEGERQRDKREKERESKMLLIGKLFCHICSRQQPRWHTHLLNFKRLRENLDCVPNMNIISQEHQ